MGTENMIQMETVERGSGVHGSRVLIGRCDKGNMMGSERGMLEDRVSMGRRGVKIGEEIGNEGEQV